MSSTSLRSRWASLRRSATCRWSLRRSTASMAASLRTAVMKASRGSSEAELEEPDGGGRGMTCTVTWRAARLSVDASPPPMTHLVFQLRASSGSRPAPSPPPTAWPPEQQPNNNEKYLHTCPYYNFCGRQHEDNQRINTVLGHFFAPRVKMFSLRSLTTFFHTRRIYPNSMKVNILLLASVFCKGAR